MDKRSNSSYVCICGGFWLWRALQILQTIPMAIIRIRLFVAFSYSAIISIKFSILVCLLCKFANIFLSLSLSLSCLSYGLLIGHIEHNKQAINVWIVSKMNSFPFKCSSCDLLALVCYNNNNRSGVLICWKIMWITIYANDWSTKDMCEFNMYKNKMQIYKYERENKNSQHYSLLAVRYECQ